MDQREAEFRKELRDRYEHDNQTPLERAESRLKQEMIIDVYQKLEYREETKRPWWKIWKNLFG